MEKQNWRVDGYIASGTNLVLILDGLTEIQAIALADRLQRIYGIECFASEKM